MTWGQILLVIQGVLYLLASVAYFSSGNRAMSVVMACYGIANFGLLQLK